MFNKGKTKIQPQKCSAMLPKIESRRHEMQEATGKNRKSRLLKMPIKGTRNKSMRRVIYNIMNAQVKNNKLRPKKCVPCKLCSD